MDDLLIKYLLGEASSEEEAQVVRWLEADAANRKRYEEYKSLWAISRRRAVEAAARSEMARSWEDLGRSGARRMAGFQKERKGWLRLAAVMTGILLLGASGYIALMDRRPAPAPAPVAGNLQPRTSPITEVPTAVKSLPMPDDGNKPDREKKIWRGGAWQAGAPPKMDTLPDGTVVILNRGASLEIVSGSTVGWVGSVGTVSTVGIRLVVRLRGEAFFSVYHDPARAFVVQAGELAFRVLGTSFDLRESGDGTIQLAVETGSVRAGDSGSVRAGDSMVVHADELLSITGKKNRKIGPNRDRLYGYYLGRPMVCENIPLRSLVEVLNRVNDTPIVLARKELGDLPLTTIFRDKTPESILDIVALTFNLSVVRQGPKIILQ